MRVIEIETKAGEAFFDFITAQSNNFATQSANSLSVASGVSDYKVILNPNRLNDLADPTKAAAAKTKVVNAWKSHSKDILGNQAVKNIFIDYWSDISQIQSNAQFESLLNARNDWFQDIFLHTNF